MKVLFIGDVVGEPGRRAVRQLLPALRQQHALDYVIANGENSAGGNGFSWTTVRDLFDCGVDVLTSGDHLWDQKEILAILEKEPRVLRPLNYPATVPGQGSIVLQHPQKPPLAVLCLQGRTFMPPLDNPFPIAKSEALRLRAQTPNIFLDFHAEATSEKIAMGWFLDGAISALVGTHTHVQTADEQILPQGAAYLSDAGFTGPHDSVLGRKTEAVIQRFLSHMPQRFEIASGRIQLHGAVIDIDESTGRARSILRVAENLLSDPPPSPAAP